MDIHRRYGLFAHFPDLLSPNRDDGSTFELRIERDLYKDIASRQMRAVRERDEIINTLLLGIRAYIGGRDVIGDDRVKAVADAAEALQSALAAMQQSQDETEIQRKVQRLEKEMEELREDLR